MLNVSSIMHGVGGIWQKFIWQKFSCNLKTHNLCKSYMCTNENEEMIRNNLQVGKLSVCQRDYGDEHTSLSPYNRSGLTLGKLHTKINVCVIYHNQSLSKIMCADFMLER